MAEKEHLEKLKQGVDSGNSWRLENSNIVPDLSDTNLQGKDLREVNFRRVKNLSVKQLSKATTLHGAELDEELRKKVEKVV